MAQKKKTGIAGVVDNVAVKLGIKKKEEKTPAKIIEENRAKGNEIASYLKAIDFYHGAYKGKTEADSPENMQKKVAAMVRIIDKAHTISDDISKIDEVLLYAAKALNAAIADGDYNKAIWAKNALSAGVLYLRDNVPADHEEQHDEILDARGKYLQNYKAIIQLYEKADQKKKAVDDFDNRIKEVHSDYDPKVTKIKALKDSPEGRLMYGNIKTHEDEPGQLGEEEKKFLEFIREAAAQAHTIFRMDSMRSATQLEYEQAMYQAEDVRTTLMNKPYVYNKELSAYHALVLQEQINTIARVYAEYAAYTEKIHESDRALKSVLNGADAQSIAIHAVTFMDDIINGESNDYVEAAREGNRMAVRANKAIAESREALKAAAEEIQKTPHYEENEDLSELFSEMLNEATAEAEYYEDLEEGNVNYNFT